MWESLDSELQFTELKPENTINRLTSEANPRFLERVVKGSFFNLEMIYSVYDEKDEENLKLVYQALRLLEHSGLGGSISRGYGRIKFRFTEPLDVSVEDYKTGSAKYAKSVAPVSEENNEGWKSLDQISTI
jgi:CRISPR-associated protein Csm3